MKAIVIGGTQDFGKNISENLQEKGYDVITVGRSSNANYVCDLSQKNNWIETLERIAAQEDQIDLLGCVVGFARAKSSSVSAELTRRLNYDYVVEAFEKLRSNLQMSKNPRAFTIGTIWSYKARLDELKDYVESKRQLCQFTQGTAKQYPWLTINMYCVPTMDTFGYRQVLESFEKIGMKEVLEKIPKTNPKTIAKALVELATQTSRSGKVIHLDGDGKSKVVWG